MLAILTITFPIYAAIALGYVTVKTGVFSASDMRVLGKYVMNIALPALLFNAVASRDIAEVFNPTYMAVFLAAGLATISISYIWFTAVRTSASRRAVAVLGTSSPNSGYIGYPMMLLAFPDIAGVVLALNMLVENFVLIPLCLALMEFSKGGDAHVIRKTAIALSSVLKRPMVIGLILGLVFSLLGLELAQAVTRLMSMLAASASALALFVIGGSLVGLPMRGNWKIAVQITVGKLLLHPIMAIAAVYAIAWIGMVPLSREMQAAVILSAATPMFGIYALLAQEHGHEGMASISQLIATVGAFFTLSLLLTIFS